MAPSPLPVLRCAPVGSGCLSTLGCPRAEPRQPAAPHALPPWRLLGPLCCLPAERTQERQDMLAQLGWQDASAAQPTSTAGGTASAATAAPSTSAGQEAVQQRPRRRAASQQQPAGGASAGGAQSARSGPSRRLPADIRQQLEALQAQRTQQAGQHTTGQSLSSGWAAPPLPPPRPTPSHSHQPTRTVGHTSHSHAAPAGLPRPGAQDARHAAGRRHLSHHHSHSHEGYPNEHNHHNHTCSHPHEDCTSDCCSAPTVPAPGSAMAAAAAPCVAAPDPACLSALAAALQQQAASSSDAPSLAAAAAPGSLLLLCEQLGLPATLAAALQAPSGPAAAAAQAQAPPVASTSPELPGEGTRGGPGSDSPLLTSLQTFVLCRACCCCASFWLCPTSPPRPATPTPRACSDRACE